MHKIKPARHNILPPDPVFTLKSDMGYVHCLNFFQEGTAQLLAATEKGLVYFWDLNTHRVSCKKEMGKSIQAIHSFYDRIITQEKGGLLKLWSVEKMEVIDKYEYAGGFCKSIIMDDIIVIPQENCIDLVDKQKFSKINTLTPEKENLGQVMALEKVYFGSCYYILAGYETGDIVLWNISTSKSCSHSKLQPELITLTFDSSVGRGVCGSSSNILQVFTINTAFETALKCEISQTSAGCNVVRIRPDRKVLVSGNWDSRIRIYSWKTLRTLAVLTEHKESITDVQFSPGTVSYWDSNIMAVSGADGVISLWDLYN